MYSLLPFSTELEAASLYWAPNILRQCPTHRPEGVLIRCKEGKGTTSHIDGLASKAQSTRKLLHSPRHLMSDLLRILYCLNNNFQTFLYIRFLFLIYSRNARKSLFNISHNALPFIRTEQNTEVTR